MAAYTRGRPPTIIPAPLIASLQEPPAGAFSLPNHSLSALHNSAQFVTVHSSRNNSPVPSADIGGQYHGPSSPITFLERAWKRFKQHHISTIANSLEKETPTTKFTVSVGDKPYPEFSGEAFCLPAEEYARQLVNKYFDISTPFYRFLHQGSVERWIGTLYQQRPNDGPRSLSTGKLTVLLMMFAEATFYESGCDCPPGLGEKDSR